MKILPIKSQVASASAAVVLRRWFCCCLFNVLPLLPFFVGVNCKVCVLFCSTLCPFLFCNHVAGEERAGCFTFVASKCHVDIIVLWLFLTLLWDGILYVILAFPGHRCVFAYFLQCVLCKYSLLMNKQKNCR